MLMKYVGTGCLAYYQKSKSSHACELGMGFGDDKTAHKSATAGIMGSPFFMRYGINHQFGSHTLVKPSMTVANHVACDTDIEHKLDEHWTLNVHQHYDGRKAAAKAIHFGWSLNYEA